MTGFQHVVELCVELLMHGVDLLVDAAELVIDSAQLLPGILLEGIDVPLSLPRGLIAAQRNSSLLQQLQQL